MRGGREEEEEKRSESVEREAISCNLSETNCQGSDEAQGYTSTLSRFGPFHVPCAFSIQKLIIIETLLSHPITPYTKHSPFFRLLFDTTTPKTGQPIGKESGSRCRISYHAFYSITKSGSMQIMVLLLYSVPKQPQV